MDLTLDNSNCDSNSISDLPFKRPTAEETPGDINDDSSLPTPEKKLKLEDQEDLIHADFKSASRRLFGEKVLSGQSTSEEAPSSSSFKGQMPRKNDECKPSIEPNSNEGNDPLRSLVKCQIKEEAMDASKEQPGEVSERLAPEVAFSVKEELHSEKSQHSEDCAMEVTQDSVCLANTRIEERDNVSLKIPPEHVDGGAWKLLVLHTFCVLNFTAGFKVWYYVV